MTELNFSKFAKNLQLNLKLLCERALVAKLEDTIIVVQRFQTANKHSNLKGRLTVIDN